MGSTIMRRSVRAVIALVITVLAASLLAAPASAADEAIVPGTPTVSGRAQYDGTLTAVPGAWTPGDVTFSYQWLRDGAPVGSDSPANVTRRLTSTNDIGRTYAVRVTATRDGSAPVAATSARTRPVAKGTITRTARPKISGSPRYGHRLTGTSGSWSRGVRLEYRWLRNDKPISGATGRHHTVGPSDVGAKIRFRVKAKRTGYSTATARSTAVTGQHVRSVRKVVTYRVATRGSISTSLTTFKRQAQETYDDPRGWRAMGVRFKRVSKGGDFTLVLSQASKVPSFSSGCSSTYSCRVGRNVIINQTRWLKASPAWKSRKGSVRSYRHLVVNHETGHWFGRGHVGCGGKGQAAPVMQQQSKGLGGCTINPWPKKNELHAPRYGW
ncbi:DUF3152 domain-containing protein [Aeromicrobium yanjiei]|uniref:DUF3152 domain-containing protein n=1 Tax=Aeromicrobium yanjiei TaxID=2662028 RepID=A0A5Q2MH29_9ACTN|nr:DUF3152 domain-containing protein [Aeromicrobium yanjiei]QGG41003.1 DUF3152 domain-containing protein [Aeromicrobium yanjiei]